MKLCLTKMRNVLYKGPIDFFKTVIFLFSNKDNSAYCLLSIFIIFNVNFNNNNIINYNSDSKTM